MKAGLVTYLAVPVGGDDAVESVLRAEGYAPRPATGLWALLTPEQRRAALADDRVVASGDQSLPKVPR